MTKEELQYYSWEIEITNKKLYESLDENDSLIYVIYSYNSNNNLLAKERIETAIKEENAERLINAIIYLNEHGGHAPSEAKLFYIGTDNLIELGILYITEFTIFNVDEYIDEYE